MKKKILLDCIIYFSVGLAIWLCAFFIKQPYHAEDIKNTYRYCSDSFIIPAMVLIGIYLLSLIAHQGFFDGLTYSFHFVVGKFLPRIGNSTDNYYDYKQAKAAKRKNTNIGGLISGGIYMFFAILFYILYYCV